MSQSGYTPIQLYRTSTASATPTAGNLAAGELAINLTDEKLFFKNAAGTVKTLATSGASTVGGSNTQVQFNSSGTLAGSANFVFDGTNVGIGATPAAWFGNSRVLQLGSGGTLEGRSNLPNLVQLSANSYIDAAGVTKYINTAAASSYLQYLGAHTWYTAASGTAGATVSFTQAMVIDANANITMGTSGAFSIPGTKLSITNPAATNTYVSIYGGTGSTNGGILLGGNNAENFANVFWNTSSNLLQIAATPVSSAIKFDTAGSERMRIFGTGDVGIGTTSLAYSFTGRTVLGIDGASSSLIEMRSGGTQRGYIIGDTSGVKVASATGVPLLFETNGAEQFRILISGGITSANVADAVGYKGLPQNQQTSTYTLALADMGDHVYTTAGAFTITIPANATTAFPIGAAITIINEDANKTLAPAAGVTLVLAGTAGATTGNRTLAIGSVVTVIKVGTNRWFVSGAGVT
jgi:hypothetical protein